jgi:hypothetical protein
MKRRVASSDELERAVRRFGAERARAELHRRGLIPPIAGGTGFALTTNHGTQTSAFGTGTVQAAGDLLVVGLWNFNSTCTLTALQDTIGTSYTIKTVSVTGAGFGLGWGFAGGTGANSLTTMTWSNAAATTFGSYAEFNGTSVSGATADGVGAAISGTSGTSIATPTYTTLGSDDLIVNFAAPASSVSAFAFAGGWIPAAVSASFGGIAYQADVGAATYTPSASWTTSTIWGSIVVAFKAVDSQTILPDADVTTTGWATAPLYSKLNDSSDATYVSATLS